MYTSQLFFIAAIVIMLIIIISDFIKRRYNIDLNNIDSSKIKAKFALKNSTTIKKSTGEKSLVLISAGDNKATVMATLRQITKLDYDTAKKLVDAAPSVLMSDISEDEANLNKKALEFVGAKVEIK